MPTYDYRCTSCGALEEVMQKMSDPHLTHCSHCFQASLERKPSRGVRLQFKGSGFYQTDYCSTQEGSCCPCSKSKPE